MVVIYSLCLSVSFLMLATIVVWMMVYTKGVADWAKSVVILMVLWYGLVVFHTPSKMMGWPYRGESPDMGVVLSWKVIDPQINPRDAGIYLWIVPKKAEKKEIGLLESLIPSNIFTMESTSIPRAYRFPYSAEEHQRLGESQGKLGKGDVLVFKKGCEGENGEGKRRLNSERQYRILKFDELFQKTGGDT